MFRNFYYPKLFDWVKRKLSKRKMKMMVMVMKVLHLLLFLLLM